MNKIIRFISLIFSILLITGCNDLLEYSPFDANVSSTDINIENIKLLSDSTARDVKHKDTVTFAVIADSHDYYDDLVEAINSINTKEGIDFVICCGDITSCGISQEYIWYQELIKKIKYPVLTVIGNHDHRSDGLKIFLRMFGPNNMSFIYAGYKFILFDDVVWENNNKSPDFEWLKKELAKDDLPVILATHIPPWGEQMEGVYDQYFSSIIAESNIILCLHGHHHSPYEKIFAGVPAIVAGSVEKHVYRIVRLFNNQSEVETIYFK
jgi:3',5'-cyclic-AMP phosphodiesterase